jgi:hypothetical protein
VKKEGPGSSALLPSGHYDCLDPTLWEREIKKAPLTQRAWVVQERLLSPRVVHFGANQLFWECQELQACETYPDGLPDTNGMQSCADFKIHDPFAPELRSSPLLPSSTSPKVASDADWKLLALWSGIVEVYSVSCLTYFSDKLIAISGVAKILAAQTKARYLAGLWSADLVRQLLWRTSSPTSRHAETLVAPSWSWASIKSPVSNVLQVSNEHSMVSDLLEVLTFRMTVTDPDDLTMRISEGRLRLRARLIPCSLARLDDSRGYMPGHRYNLTVRGLEKSAMVYNDTEQSDRRTRSFACRLYSLITKRTDPSKSLGWFWNLQVRKVSFAVGAHLRLTRFWDWMGGS